MHFKKKELKNMANLKGANLSGSDLVLRTGKVAFFLTSDQIGKSTPSYARMEGFTSLSTSKSAIEYTRRYVDEDFERSDVTGYGTSISYAFDRYQDNDVLDDIITIHEDEKVGADCVRSILQVDMTTAKASTTLEDVYTATARERAYAVIPDSDGDSTDCLTYSGSFRARGEIETVTVATMDGWQTVTINKE